MEIIVPIAGYRQVRGATSECDTDFVQEFGQLVC